MQGNSTSNQRRERAFSKLGEALEQGQFELLFTEEKIRLVYLMNDAVESFLVFENARMTGEYIVEWEGEMEAELSIPEELDDEYVLVVRRGETVVTLFFEDLSEEIYLYDYGEIGHFWVKGAEYLRQIEYKIAIVRDKLDYLGEEYCNQIERKLAALADFPPLNHCCYPAVSKQYIVSREDPWVPSAAAHQTIQELAAAAEDKKLLRSLGLYQKYPWKWFAKRIARMLEDRNHAAVTDLLLEELKMAAASYPRRKFTDEEECWNHVIDKKALDRKRELEEQGFQVDVFREEPFVALKDSIQYKVSLMIWNKKGKKRKVQIEEFQ
ncbi:MAG: DUF3878 family protein [[Ruminococcus] gnavus]|nr:DUF3878 family protein [Mediterraneibacter gnavus]